MRHFNANALDESYPLDGFEFGEELDAFEATEGLDETVEMEMASQLLEIADESELDLFIGRLIKRAGRAAGQFVRSDADRALGGVLKSAAKKALPVLGGALGSYIGGPAGGRTGSRIATHAGTLFGLELEGLSEEDQEFEVARRLVRFSDAAAKTLANMPSNIDAYAAAKSAAIAAAKDHAPGLIRPAQPGQQCQNCGSVQHRDPSSIQGCENCARPDSGRWIRRGRHIIIVNP